MAERIFSEKKLCHNNGEEVSSTPIEYFFVAEVAKTGSCWGSSAHKTPVAAAKSLYQVPKMTIQAKKPYFNPCFFFGIFD